MSFPFGQIRAPGRSNAEKRAKWITEIQKHQEFRDDKTNISICIRHFENDFLIRKQNKVMLTPNAYPTKYLDNNESTAADSAVSDLLFENDTDRAPSICLSCIDLRTELIDLKKEMFKTDMEHSIQVQSLMRQIEELKKQNMNNSTNIYNMRQQLTKAKQEIIDIQQQNSKDIDERLFSIDKNPIHHVCYSDGIYCF